MVEVSEVEIKSQVPSLRPQASPGGAQILVAIPDAASVQSLAKKSGGCMSDGFAAGFLSSQNVQQSFLFASSIMFKS